MKFELTSQDITNQATSLVNFHKRFAKFFQTRISIESGGAGSDYGSTILRGGFFKNPKICHVP